MSLPKFTDILSLSNVEISEAIIETKYTKRHLAHLKTLLTLRLENVEQTDEINN